MFIWSIIKAAVITVSATRVSVEPGSDSSSDLIVSKDFQYVYQLSRGCCWPRHPSFQSNDKDSMLNHFVLHSSILTETYYVQCKVWKDDASRFFHQLNHPKRGHSVITSHYAIYLPSLLNVNDLNNCFHSPGCLPTDAGHALRLRGAVQEESWPSIWAAGHHQQLCMKTNKALRKAKERHRTCPQ